MHWNIVLAVPLALLSFISSTLAQGSIGGSQALCSASQAWVQMGCYDDDRNGRHVGFNWQLQSGTSDAKYYPGFTGSGNMTVEICLLACRGHGFRYVVLTLPETRWSANPIQIRCALLWSRMLLCSYVSQHDPIFKKQRADTESNRFPYYVTSSSASTTDGPGTPAGPNPPLTTAASQCQSACSGNSSEYCGGGGAATVYQDPSFTYTSDPNAANPYNYKYLGCYNNVSPGPMFATINTVNTTNCEQYCGALGYPFIQRAAIDSATTSSTCGCGTEIQAGFQISESSCSYYCNGSLTAR